MNVIDRDVVKTELTRLKKQHGFLTPELVLDEAKNPNSPLHDSAGFEWDTDAAAERHWLHHARILIKTIRIQITVENTVYEHPKFVRHPHVMVLGSFEPSLNLLGGRRPIPSGSPGDRESRGLG